jgi:hypothetical protein
MSSPEGAQKQQELKICQRPIVCQVYSSLSHSQMGYDLKYLTTVASGSAVAGHLAGAARNPNGTSHRFNREGVATEPRRTRGADSVLGYWQTERAIDRILHKPRRCRVPLARKEPPR